MKKNQIAGLFMGLAVCGVIFGGCGKNEATEAVKESVETEKEGSGESTEEETKNDQETEKDTQTDGTSKDAGEEDADTEEALNEVGILFPEEKSDINSSLERTELKSRLEEAGYDPVFYYAEEDADVQVSQIRELLQKENLKALILSPVDAYSMGDVLTEVSQASIPVVDYDDLIMDTDQIKYFVTFNTRAIGKEIAKNIVKKEDLDKVREAKESRTIEFFMGSPDDDASLFLFNGIMEVLQEYVDDGTLVCRSGKLTFDENSIMDQDVNTAAALLKEITGEFYQEEKAPDIICTASDAFALAAVDMLEKDGFVAGEENWPLITGVNAEAEAVKSVAEGKMGFTVLMDRRDLAEACVTLVDTWLKGDDVEVSNYSQYDNGVKIIGTVTCDGKVIDKDNYQIMVDNGFYLADMIAPEASPTPTPEASPTPTIEISPTSVPETASTVEISPTPTMEAAEDLTAEKVTPTPEIAGKTSEKDT